MYREVMLMLVMNMTSVNPVTRWAKYALHPLA